MDADALPLAPFEHYMLADDRSAYPMTFWFRLTFSGRLDVRRVRVALDDAVTYHRLLRSVIRGSPRWRTSWLTWASASRQPTVHDENSQAADPVGARSALDIFQEPGVRVWVQTDGHCSRLLVQFHHCCCDAFGALNFLETWLRIQHVGTEVPAPDTEWIAARTQSHVSWRSHVRRLPRDLMRTADFFRTTPCPLACDGQYPEPGDALPFQSRHLDRNLTMRLRHASRLAGATVNDSLLRDLFLVLSRWNCQHGSTGALRITMPMNMRPKSQVALPAMNDVSMVFLDRTLSAAPDATALLADIVHETRTIKQWGMGETLLQVLRLCGRVPWGIMGLVGTRHCASTAVLSNLGVIFAGTALRAEDGRLRVRDHVLETVEFFPPIRPLVRAAFGVLTYAGCLTICLHYDPFALTQAQGVELLDEYIRRVSASPADAVPHPV